jgi:PAS domain S-box-containing protein
MAFSEKESMNTETAMINEQPEIISVLLIEDNPVEARLIREMLARPGRHQVKLTHVERLDEGLQCLDVGEIHIVLLDLGLPDSQGLDTLSRTSAQAPELPIIILTGLNDDSSALLAIRRGAQDYLVKGQIDTNLLMRSVQYAIERKQSELALRASEERFRRIIEKNADGIVIVGRDGIVRFVNPAAEHLFDRQAEELLDYSFGFPVPARETVEIDIVRKDGETAVAEMRTVDMDWEGEKAYLVTLRDVTEIHRARKRLELLANLVENASYVMIFIVSPDGQILECNVLASNTFGYSEDEMLANGIDDLFKPGAYQGWEEIAGYVGQKGSWRGELMAMGKNGREFPVDIAASRSKGEEMESANIICFIRDVSKEKEIDRMKSEFISSASHEMRTPLTSIKNAVDLILKRKAGEITDVQEKFLCMAQRNIERFASLIDELLDISRIELGKMRLNYTEMDIRASIENVMNMFRSAADEKSISLQMDMHPNLPTIYADVSRIEEVIINLVGNAIKFTPDNGAVTVAAHEEEVSDMLEGLKGFLDISTTDTGVGIPEKEIDHIFDRFYQVESSLSVHKKSGSGLGLAIAKYVVEAYGGKIRCKSREGQGSTFSFTIPVIDEEQVLIRILNDELCRARQSQQALSVLIFKKEDYAELMETHGEEECKRTLKTVKDTILKGRVKKTDTVVLAPTRGEILLILPETDGSDARIAQKRIGEYLASNETTVEENSYRPSFISGTATFPGDGTSAEELVDRARKQLKIEY